MKSSVSFNHASAKGLHASGYAQKKKALMSTINQIRATGASVDVDLPTIVVAGNQSSGKSSLIEAISGVSFAIRLPRAAGTCTRVPMEVRLKQADNVPWTCVVKVRREGSEQLDDQKPEVEFGKTITDPSLVEATIRRAQLAILNPSIKLENFVNYVLPVKEEEHPLGSERQLSFSENVVVLEITGQEVTDLTLVDLPGIISNAGPNGDEKDVKLIEDMVTGYIKKDCLILLVMTMTDDIQNQKAARFAREADPEGKRTIGVLTKVDMLQGTAEPERWLETVRNLDKSLALGYYVTRQPNSDELSEGITFSRARDLEDSFFHNTGPWKQVEPSIKKRLGTKNLSAALSDLLLKFIKDTFPELEKKIARRYAELKAEIQSLGEPPSEDPASAILGLFTNFDIAIKKHIDGQQDHESFIQAVNELDNDFAEDIKATEPIFVAIERSEIPKGDGKPSNQSILEEVLMDPEQKMYLDDMRLHIKGCRTWELPNQVPPSAVSKLIKRSMSGWDDFADAHLDNIRPVIQSLLEELIITTFGKHDHGGLPRFVGAIVNDQLDILYENTRIYVKKLVAMDGRPQTSNTRYLSSNQTKSLALHKSVRGPSVACPEDKLAEQASHIRDALASLVAVGHQGVTEGDLAKLAPVDEYETEMGLMSQTTAYWTVAYKCVIDNVPKGVALEYLAPLADVIRAALIKEVKVFGADATIRCKELLDEDPEISDMRNDLTVRRTRLGVAKLAIQNFNMK